MIRWHEPTDLAAALTLIEAGSTPVAGGASLLSPAFPAEFHEDAVDLRGLLSDRVEGAQIGAMTTLDVIANDQSIRKFWPALASAASKTGTPAVRSVATIGGTIAAQLPGADLPAALAAHGAVVHFASKSTTSADDAVTTCSMPVEAYLGTPPFQTHIVTGVTMTIAGTGAFARITRTPGPGPAVATAAAVATYGETRLWVGACGKSAAPMPIGDVQDIELSSLRDDNRASAEYRMLVLRHLVDEVSRKVLS